MVYRHTLDFPAISAYLLDIGLDQTMLAGHGNPDESLILFLLTGFESMGLDL